MTAQLILEIPPRKVCIECRFSLPEGAFGRRRVGRAVRLKSHCSRCELERQKRYRCARLGREYVPPPNHAISAAMNAWKDGPEPAALRLGLTQRI